MANPIDTEGLELARKINLRLTEIRADIAALEAAVEELGGGGGVSAYTDLTDAATAALPTINTPLSSALALKLASATAASTYAPISTTVTLGTTQTLTGFKAFTGASFSGGATWLSGSEFVANDGASFLYGTTAKSDHRLALGLGALSTVTPGTGVATALAVNTGSTGAVALQGAAISGTTVTASGNVTFATSVKSTTALATPSALSATEANFYASTVSGASIGGFGTTNDVTLRNRAGTVCLGVGPNTTAINIPGTLAVTGASTFSGDLSLVGSRRISATGALYLGDDVKATIYDGLTNTFNKTIITVPTTRSGGGTVPLTHSSVALTTTGVADALTLANGTNGQILTISHVSRGGGTGTAVLTPTTSNGYTTITFTATGDSVTLQYQTTGGWHIVGSRGVTIA